MIKDAEEKGQIFPGKVSFIGGLRYFMINLGVLAKDAYLIARLF